MPLTFRSKESFDNNKELYELMRVKIAQLALFYGSMRALSDRLTISEASLSQYCNPRYRRIPSNAVRAIINNDHERVAKEHFDYSPSEKCFDIIMAKAPGYRDKVRAICESHNLVIRSIFNICTMLKDLNSTPIVRVITIPEPNDHPMKREEYYDSTDFKLLRLLNNHTHEIKQQTQRLYDIIELVAEKHPELLVGDKFTIMMQQLRITDMDAARLISVVGDVEHMLRPRSFDDYGEDGNRIKESAE